MADTLFQAPIYHKRNAPGVAEIPIPTHTDSHVGGMFDEIL